MSNSILVYLRETSHIFLSMIIPKPHHLTSSVTYPNLSEMDLQSRSGSYLIRITLVPLPAEADSNFGKLGKFVSLARAINCSKFSLENPAGSIRFLFDQSLNVGSFRFCRNSEFTGVKQ